LTNLQWLNIYLPFPINCHGHDLSAGHYRHLHNSMKRRFEQNQQDCVFTVLSLLPTLGDQLLHELNVELITSRLQQTRSQRSTPALTPDSSMILPPKPTEGEETASVSSTMEPAVGRDDVKTEPDKSEADEQVLDKDADQQPVVESHTVQGSEDEPKANDDSEADRSSEKTSDTDSSGPEVEKEASQNTPVANGSAPEIHIQQEDTEKDGSQQQPQQPQAVATQDETPTMDRRTKLELWNELKIMSFTRTITALYSLTLLTLLTQIQLNLLGRFTYVSSVVALTNTTDASYRIESPSAKGSLSSTNGQLDFQTEKKYLTFSYWLLHEGWRRWNERVREVVENVVGG